MLRSFFLYLSRQKKLERWLLSFAGAQKVARHFVAGETLPEAMEVVQDLSSRGLGMRSKRYAMLIEDGKVTAIAVEPPGEYGVSSAEAVLQRLGA